MKYLRCFAFGCLCFGSFAFLPFGLKAGVVQIDFDAKDYQSGKDWKEFIKALCKTLKEHPDYNDEKKKVLFNLTVQNSDIFGTKPPELDQCFKDFTERTEINRILGRVVYLHVASSTFSTAVPERLFSQRKEFLFNEYGKDRFNEYGKELRYNRWIQFNHYCNNRTPGSYV